MCAWIQWFAHVAQPGLTVLWWLVAEGMVHAQWNVQFAPMRTCMVVVDGAHRIVNFICTIYYAHDTTDTHAMVFGLT